MKKFRIYSPERSETEIGPPLIYGLSVDYAGGEHGPELNYIDVMAESVGDEYHTMHELYQHRMHLTAALFRHMHMVHEHILGKDEAQKAPLVMKSKLHNDGTMFAGYFIVMAISLGGQISYHYDLKYWDLFQIPEVERTPKYDGHTSRQVLERLGKL